MTHTAEVCIRCGRALDPAATHWVELSIDSGLYYAEGTFPKDHQSQGCFPIGLDCFVAVRDAGGKLRRIGRAAKR